ncbi:glycosyltransferase family 4 protein [Salipaludibacillus aurantiacus]|uniref:Glycosyltransferase involved in cell wall bisynthesis n=1 Tax=Salipaludibacillus aurantiacus TaxID=1601833 RepID=A0A1H9X9Q9_9BACI|nr:glycosyltransferase family 4 protein [Salipaludibacillus aurantiacus]SES42865.1 Glycosyltransferase involved in cell wall bisynthesis [Salipaludibacillus aurantiacus]
MKKENNIAIFTMGRSLSGAEKRFIRIASELNKKRDNIILILNRRLYNKGLEDKEISDRLKNLKIILINNEKYSNRFRNMLYTFISVYLALKKNNVSLLHGSLGGLKYAFIGKILKAKTVGEITSPDVAEKISTTNLRYVIPFLDKLITVSPGVKQRTIENLEKIKKHKINQIYCSSIPFFLPQESYSTIEFSKKEKLIVFASRFIKRKNPLLFANVVKKILDEDPEWKVAILGQGPLEEEVKCILKDHLDKKRVVVEYTKDLYGYLKRSKLFVSLIYPDNYPSQSILEAMYMKNAIVATDVGNTNKLVTKDNGYLVKDYEVNSVYETLKEAVSNQERLEEMGEQSAKLIEEKFSKDIYLKELQAIYKSLE